MTLLDQPGRTRAQQPGPVIEISNPQDGTLVGSLPMSSPAYVEDAVFKARRAQVAWARTDPAERGKALRAIAQTVREHCDELAALNGSAA